MVLTPGRGGRGGGACITGAPRLVSIMLCGRAGNVGGWSLAGCDVAGLLDVPFRPSLSALLFAREGWIGGGSNESTVTSNVLARLNLSNCAFGRAGKAGGASSSLNLSLLFRGGLLNGDTLSLGGGREGDASLGLLG